MKTTLGIDLGTQSLKVLIYDYLNHAVRYAGSVALPLQQDESGKAEQDANDWTEALTRAMQGVPDDIRQSVVSISVSGQQHGFVALNAQGDVIAPVKLWCDATSQAECEQIMHRVGGPDECINASGNILLPSYTAAKILAMKERFPARYKQLDCILLPHDYVNFWLTGERCMEMGDASGTGLLDVQNRRWSETMLQAIDASGELQECLPKLREGVQVIGHLQASTANRLGLSAGVPVATGGGDNMMAAIGTGTVSDGRLAMSLGTSGTLFAFSKTPVVDPAGRISAFCSSTGGWLPLFCSMSCTVTTELYRHLFNFDFQQVDTSLKQTPIGANGVTTLPYFNGERSPNLPNGKGVILGLDAQNTRPENLLRSGVEGVTFALYQGLITFKSLGIACKQLVLTGGGANSPEWCQMIADVFNLPITVPTQCEGAAFGAALQAVSVIENDGVVDAPFVDPHLNLEAAKVYLPEAQSTERYADVFQRYLHSQQHITALYR